MKRAFLLTFALALAGSAALAAEAPQQQPFPPFEVDQVKVDKAIAAGVKYLKANNASHLKRFTHIRREMQECELVLYTYVHAGVPENAPEFKELWDDMMKRQLEATYCVALQAMILEDVQRVKWQYRIKACAQFLVDNQCANGQWTYGDPSIFAELDDTPTTAPKSVASGRRRGGLRKFAKLPPPGVKVKPPVTRILKVTKQRPGPGSGDNSNTQYAALGLRACHDAGIALPKDVIALAESWWRKSQYDDPKLKEEPLQEGGVAGAFKKGQKIADGVRRGRPTYTTYAMKRARPAGWCYRARHDHEAYGSMSAGAIGGLAIYDYIKDNDGGQKQSWKKDKDIHEGLQWMAKNFSVTFNPGPYEHGDKARDSQHQFHYYLYAMERAGMLYGTEVMGDHKWYPEGAKFLIGSQGKDGSWGSGTRQTCFAILFLKRATAPLGVATHSAGDGN